MGWYVVFKPSRPADCHRWYDRYRSLPWGGAFPFPNRTSIILVYILTGIFMYLMMRAIGEMLYMDPDQHTFINFITKYLGKGLGILLGLVLLGITDFPWNGRNYGRLDLCAILVPKLACLADSDYLPDYPEFG